MKTVAAELLTLLETGHFAMADMYQFTLVNALVLRYTSFDYDITLDGNDYSSSGLLIKRSNLSWKNDLSVDSLNMEIYPQASGLVSGMPFLTAVRLGLFDGASVQLKRAFFSIPVSFPPVPAGSILMFLGRVGDIELARDKADFLINSHLELLNALCPRELYEANCSNELYGTICRATPITANGTVAVVNAVNSINTDLNDQYEIYTGGIIEWTSGANDGLKGTISYSKDSLMKFVIPFPSTIQVGDTFEATAGCIKTRAMCEFIFGNIANFKGFPFIPLAESVLVGDPLVHETVPPS